MEERLTSKQYLCRTAPAHECGRKSCAVVLATPGSFLSMFRQQPPQFRTWRLVVGAQGLGCPLAAVMAPCGSIPPTHPSSSSRYSSPIFLSMFLISSKASSVCAQT